MEQLKRQFHRYTCDDITERIYKKHRVAGAITQDDEALIREYITECESAKNIGEARKQKLVSTLTNWRRFILQPYRGVTITEIYAGISRLKEYRDPVKGLPYRQNTLHDYLRNVKPFFLWLEENEYNSLPVKKIKKIKPPAIDRDCTAPDDILTKEEVALLIDNCLSPRDRALIITLYESGCRVGELARMEWRDLVFDKWGVKVYIHDTKCGQTRYCRLVNATPHLLLWKNSYPGGQPEGDARVFIARDRREIIDITVDRTLKRAANLAGITKRVYPHLFRKSRTTHMVAEGYQESVIKASLWGNQDTEMFRTYVHLAEREIDAEFLAKAGLVVKEETQSDALKPTVCSRCHTLNGPG
jgi:integrase